MKKLLAYLSLIVPQSLLTTKYLLERIPLLAADPSTCDHEWDVVASISSTVELQVQCRKCAIYSEIPDPTEQEWDASYGAMATPYPWEEKSRIRHYQANGPIH